MAKKPIEHRRALGRARVKRHREKKRAEAAAIAAKTGLTLHLSPDLASLLAVASVFGFRSSSEEFARHVLRVSAERHIEKNEIFRAAVSNYLPRLLRWRHYFARVAATGQDIRIKNETLRASEASQLKFTFDEFKGWLAPYSIKSEEEIYDTLRQIYQLANPGKPLTV